MLADRDWEEEICAIEKEFNDKDAVEEVNETVDENVEKNLANDATADDANADDANADDDDDKIQKKKNSSSSSSSADSGKYCGSVLSSHL